MADAIGRCQQKKHEINDKTPKCFTISLIVVCIDGLEQGSPTWCPRAPGRPQRARRSPAGLL